MPLSPPRRLPARTAKMLMRARAAVIVVLGRGRGDMVTRFSTTQPANGS